MTIAPPAPTSLVGEAPSSPAGPIDAATARRLLSPPKVPLSRTRAVLQFSQRQIEFVFRWRRALGEVFRMEGIVGGRPVITSHPDHVKSLFTAKPEQAPSLTGESPLRPIVGPNSVLTSIGPRHMRQRKLLLPFFHGEAIDGYRQMIADAAAHEIDRWPVGREIALAPRMQAITLDVIMGGIFGIEGRPRIGTPEHAVRTAVRTLLTMSTWPLGQLAELMNIGRAEPVGLTKSGMELLDRPTYAVIAARRKAEDLDERRDILSMLLRARTEDGETLTDEELRDELLTLVLAGHETTANQLAWTWERLLRHPTAHERLRDEARAGGERAAEVVEQTIYEGMRSRPVIPIIGRRVAVPWQLGDYAVEAGTPVTMSILLVHHREDVYPDPFAFRPERWRDVKQPGTYTWIPFGGGIRRCLGSSLAMTEQEIVLDMMARRLDLEAASPEPERALHRNVTMIPARGARAVVRGRR